MDSTGMPLAIFAGVPGWAELLVIATVGLLIFGRRLPEVGRSLGKGIVEFKRGIRGIEDEVEDTLDEADRRSRYLPPKDRDVSGGGAAGSAPDGQPTD